MVAMDKDPISTMWIVNRYEKENNNRNHNSFIICGACIAIIKRYFPSKYKLNKQKDGNYRQ